MQTAGPLDLIPLWLLLILMVALALLSVEAGFRLGNYRRTRHEEEKEAPVGAMVGATLGLLAFMLAFTFGLAASRFDDRRNLVLNEANGIGTTFLRTALLPEPQRAEIRRLLREYVDVRLAVTQPGKIVQVIQRSETLQNQLWAQAVAAGEKNPNSVMAGLFISSLNEVIDLHAQRIHSGLRSRIPVSIWLTLFFVSMLSLGELGYYAGLSDSRRSLAFLALVLTFAAVMYLIADLDRPGEGMMQVSQQTLVDLRDTMAKQAP